MTTLDQIKQLQGRMAARGIYMSDDISREVIAVVLSISHDQAMGDVFLERQRQDMKWGQQNHEDFIWGSILGEEVGEAHQAILHDHFGGEHEGTLRQELVQVAAVAVQWIQCIDRRAALAALEGQQ